MVCLQNRGLLSCFLFGKSGLMRHDSTYKATPGTGNLPWVALAERAEAFKQPRGQISFRGLPEKEMSSERWKDLDKFEFDEVYYGV